MSSWIFNQSTFIKRFMRQTEKQRITVINAGSNKTLNQGSGRTRGKGRMSTRYILKMQISRRRKITMIEY